MCLWRSLFYYQYSTSGGRVQAESLIFRSGRLNFEQSAPASALIPNKGILAFDNPILDSPAVLPVEQAAQGVGESDPLTGEKQAREYPAASGSRPYPTSGGNPNRPGKVAVWGLWRVWRGALNWAPLCPVSGHPHKWARCHKWQLDNETLQRPATSIGGGISPPHR